MINTLLLVLLEVKLLKEYFTGVEFAKFVSFVTEYLEIRNIWDVVKVLFDIGVVSFVIFKLTQMIRETRAWQLLKGVLVILVAAKIADLTGLKTVAYLLNETIQLLPIVLLILFQPEIRRALEGIGKSKFKNLFSIEDQDSSNIAITTVIDEVVKASGEMSKEHVGALIIFEMYTKLGEVIRSGTTIDAEVSSPLIQQIFSINTPLHDGALIIRGTRLYAAACFLPLTDNNNLSKDLGTRHRAAIGITEVSDCISVVVSEETGKISISRNGVLTRNIAPETLKRILLNCLIKEDKKLQHKKFVFWRGRKP